MTREEAIEILKAHHMWTGEPQEIIEVRKENTALNMAIKALEQEPCDQIKWERDTAIAQLKELGYGLGEKPKTGHWIKHENPNLGQCGLVSYECSSCGVWLGCQYFSRRSYCPNCGAKMESEG